MILFFLSCLSGINLAFSLLSFFIWYKNRDQKLYLYFTIFSFFSAIYIFLISISNSYEFDFTPFQILSAAIYYAVFPWFIYEYLQKKDKLFPLVLSGFFAIAFLLFFTKFSLFGFPLWQIFAHLGLLGFIYVLLNASYILNIEKNKKSFYFKALTLFFIFLALEEVITYYLNTKLLANYITAILPLDVYPLIFSIIIGQKLTNDLYKKSELELDLSKSDLKRKELEIEVLKKGILEKKLTNKNKDLTDFGIKLNKYSKNLKNILKLLNKYRSNNKVKSDDLDTLIQDIKSQIRIDNRQELFQEKIEEVNHEFIESIKNKYPSLTENELNLICLLKLKLTTKEIASIKNITPDSVKVLRYRIRKKLELTTSTNLSSFLNDLA